MPLPLALLTTLNVQSLSPSIIEDAIIPFNRLILEDPMDAGCYNDRAEARRLQYLQIVMLIAHLEVFLAMLKDLGDAISLGLSPSHQQSVSRGSKTILASAYTRRVLLLYKSWQMPQEKRDILFSMMPELTGLTDEAILELASRDFAMWGKDENEMAKQMAVLTNPYAKLCGSIVKEALRKRMDSSACEATTA
jgi:hypothetical protein